METVNRGKEIEDSEGGRGRLDSIIHRHPPPTPRGKTKRGECGNSAKQKNDREERYCHASGGRRKRGLCEAASGLPRTELLKA